MGHRWTQITFVQQQPHWVQDTSVTSTDVLGLPVDCVLAGQQLILDRYRTFEIHAMRPSMKKSGHRTSTLMLAEQAPSFTVKSSRRGY